MKPKNNTLQHLGFIALALAGFAATTAQAATWTGSVTDDGLFSTTANWSDTASPAGKALTFAALVNGVDTTLNNDLVGATYTGITYSANSPAYTIDGNAFTLTGNILNQSTTNTQIINSAMNFTAQRTITTSNAAAGITLGGVLSGTGGSLLIASTGAGTVTISNASNSFSGGVTIGSGTGSGNTAILRATASGALGSGTVSITGNSSAARLELTSGITLSNAINLNGVSSTTTPGIENISGSNILSGTIDLQAGGADHQIQSDAGLLTLGTAAATAITTSVTSNRNVTLQGAGNGVVVGNIINNISNVSGTVTVKKAGAGTWTLSGTNTYTGGTTINLGTILLGNNSALGLGTVSLGSGGVGSDSALLTNGAFAISGGTITVNSGGGGRVLGGNTANASSFANNIVSGTGAFRISQVSGGTLTLSGTIANTGLMTFINEGNVSVTNAISGTAGALVQSGSGTTTLSGSNSYTGATTVSAGTLAVNGNQIAATGAVTVSNSGTRLIGTGTLGANTTTISSGAIHSAGGAVANVDKVGLQTFDQTLAATSDLTYGAGSIFEWDLNANSNLSGDRGTGYDGVDVTGTLAVDSTSIFRVVLGSGVTSDTFWQSTQTWENIFGGGFALSGSGFNNSLLEIVNTSGGAYDLSTLSPGYQFTVSGTSLTWSAVPEPSSALIGMLVTAGLLRRRRKN
jgi:autotransporter-associated beta strand protein